MDSEPMDTDKSDSEHAGPSNPGSSDSSATKAIKALAPRVLFKFDMNTPGGSNVWPDLANAFLRPLRYSIIPNPLQSDPSSSLGLPLAHAPSHNGHDVDPASYEGPYSAWPGTSNASNKSNMPEELYALICSHLSMEDVKALRLTCSEIKFFVSHILFESTVVPFHMGIYEDARPSMVSGEGMERRVDVDCFAFHGSRMKSFGVRFEIPEAILAVPPEKHLIEPHASYWGRYNWPAPYYLRFNHLEDLEGFADEGSAVRKAFSTLSGVEELAISMDNSLGWLAGPDKSIRDQFLVEREPIVTNRFKVPSRETEAYRKLWDSIDAEYGSDRANLWCATLHLVESDYDLFSAKSSSHTQYLSRRLLWEAIGDGMTVPTLSSGFLLVSQEHGSAKQIRNHPIRPKHLSSRQIELILENWWVQHAFLTSWVMSVIDTLPHSANVHSLNIDRLSADFLDLLCRPDFWAALPNLRTLKIFAIGQFREIRKDEFEKATSHKIRPSRATPKFCELLRDHISRVRNIKELAFGWASGGEHEKGLYGRNMHLLPAPFLTYEPEKRKWYRNIEFDCVVSFPFVEKLCLKNCWATPVAIRKLALDENNECLNKLILESVSLVGYRRPDLPALQPLPPPGAGQVGVSFAIPPAAANAAPLGPGPAWIAVGPPNAGQANMPGPMIQAVHHAMGQFQAQAQAQIFNAQNPQANMPLMIPPIPLAVPPNQNQQPQTQWQMNVTQGAAPTGADVSAPNRPQVLPFLVTQPVNNPVVGGAGPQFPGGPPPAAFPVPFGALHAESWSKLLDKISPGKNLSLVGLPTAALPRDEIMLEELELISCGYCCLFNLPFRYEDLDPSFERSRHQMHLSDRQKNYIELRMDALEETMMVVRDPGLAQILQVIPASDCEALTDVFLATTGWENGEDAEAACFDQRRPGGTGRFSVVLRQDERPRTLDEEEL